MPQFDSVVATANRANVSVYTIDAAGLRVHSKDAETGREVRAIGAQSMIVNPDGSTGGSLGAMERMDDVLRKDPRTSLTLLAERTGGFLIENTNDLARGFREIDTDRRFHYLLTYTPKKLDFSGEWRRVEVRVPSRKVEIRSRSGYPAVRSLSAIPLLAYEGPALAALERTPPPADLPLRLGAFVFPDVKGGSRAALMVAASGETLTFETTPEGFRTDFTLMARVKDATGEIVRKGSQPYRLTGPAADRERTQKGEVLFYRQPELPPGSTPRRRRARRAGAARRRGAPAARRARRYRASRQQPGDRLAHRAADERRAGRGEPAAGPRPADLPEPRRAAAAPPRRTPSPST